MHATCCSLTSNRDTSACACKRALCEQSRYKCQQTDAPAYLEVVYHHKRLAQVMSEHGSCNEPNLQAEQQTGTARDAHDIDVLLGATAGGQVKQVVRYSSG